MVNMRHITIQLRSTDTTMNFGFFRLFGKKERHTKTKQNKNKQYQTMIQLGQSSVSMQIEWIRN